MSPPSGLPTKPSHSRNTSLVSAARTEVKSTKKAAVEPAVHHTVLIRLPFPRNSFVDPAPVDWDATKDRALWKIISRSSKTSDLDWEELAGHFGVEPSFMLQQAAWLYERHLQHVRAQMRKIQPTPAAAGSTSNVSSAGGYAMKRMGSGGSRAPSALSVRTRDSPVPREGSGPGTPRMGAPPLSRTPSTNTITQSRIISSPRTQQAPAPTTRTSCSIGTSRIPNKAQGKDSTGDAAQTSADAPSSPASSPSESLSSSSSSEEERRPMRRSQLLKRPPRFGQKAKTLLPRVTDEDDSDEEENLPFAAPTATRTQDMKGTLRDNKPAQQAAHVVATKTSTVPAATKGKAQATAPPVESSASSASSFAPMTREKDNRPGPLSPRHRAELTRLSPRRRKDNESAGTPSMGSSFSDLDDASISQSALEEALLSNMQHGGMSRMSNLSNAFRSRYLG